MLRCLLLHACRTATAASARRPAMDMPTFSRSYATPTSLSGQTAAAAAAAAAAAGRSALTSEADHSSLFDEGRRPSDYNSRLSTLVLTSSFLGGGLPLLDAPGLNRAVQIEPGTSTTSTPAQLPASDRSHTPETAIGDPEVSSKVIEAPAPAHQPASKQAHRMLVIRKKKMKVHRRRRRQKKFAARYRKRTMRLEKKKELEYRTELIEKVKAAKHFDAEQYRREYLEDMQEELTPKTFKGKSLPVEVIRDLMEKQRVYGERKIQQQVDLITGEPLVMPGETVEQFVARMDVKRQRGGA